MRIAICTATLLFISGIVDAQKIVTIKKEEIKVNGEKIASFDGKGGNAVRMGNYNITIVGESVPAINLKEDVIYFQNPLFDEQHWIYEVKFATGQSFFYRAAPVTKKFFGNTIVQNPRKTGNDIIEELFNDEVPLLIANKALNKENIDNFIAKHAYPKDKIMAEVKETEAAIDSIASQNIVRDTKKPLVFNLQKGTESDLGSWYIIVQDDKIIGRLYKRTGNEAVYQIWKKAPQGFILQGKEAEFVPIVITEDLSKGNGVLSKKFEAIKVINKDKFPFTSTNYNNAENDLVTALITAGLL